REILEPRGEDPLHTTEKNTQADHRPGYRQERDRQMKGPTNHARHLDETQVHAVIVNEFHHIESGNTDQSQQIGTPFSFEFLAAANDEPIFLVYSFLNGGAICHADHRPLMRGDDWSHSRRMGVACKMVM